MKKLRFLIAILSALLVLGDSLACEDKSLTVVVGNCRKAGGVKESSAILVEQDKADFTHRQSFKGRVISVDICPLQPHLQTYPHLTIDFANTPPSEILVKLDNAHPTCVFFEWFPSCITQSPGKNITPLLFPALKNAFAILSPGGDLIIDHNPYTVNLPDDYKKASEALLKVNEIRLKEVKETISSCKNLKETDIILSDFLQKADPFTLHMCQGEQQEIRNCLIFRIKNDDAPYNDAQCQFIKGRDQDINLLVSRFSSALKMDKFDLMALICNGMLHSSQGKKEENYFGYWNLFEQHYYMKTRGPLILEALRNIGFSVEENAIQYHEVNPYNKRKHAWLISAKKPI